MGFSPNSGNVLQQPNPIGSGLALEAVVESAGPDCIVPGQITPVKLLGVKVPPLLLLPFSFMGFLLKKSAQLPYYSVFEAPLVLCSSFHGRQN